MKLTIDTQKDSEEEIRHAIAMLQTFLGKTASSTVLSEDMPISPMSILNDSSPANSESEKSSPGIFSLFEDTKVTEVNHDDEEETIIIEEDPDKDVEVQIVEYD